MKLSDFRKNAAVSGLGLGSLTLGLAGIWIDQMIADQSPQHQENIQAAYRQVEQQVYSENLKALLQKGRSFLLFPRQSIITVGYDQKHGLQIKTSCKPGETYFQLAPDAFRQVQPLIEEYLGRKR